MCVLVCVSVHAWVPVCLHAHVCAGTCVQAHMFVGGGWRTSEDLSQSGQQQDSINSYSASRVP